jgi:hypothetical protein
MQNLPSPLYGRGDKPAAAATAKAPLTSKRPFKALSLLAAGGLCALLTGCATTSRPATSPPLIAEECGRPGMRHLPVPAAALLDQDARRSPLTRRATRTAQTIGVLPLIFEWHEQQGTSTAAVIQRLILRQQIMDRITLSGFEVSSVMAELNCEDERNDQLRDRLLSQENERLRNLTVAGMVIGAVTAISSGALQLANNNSAGNIISMIGGTSEVGVGIAALSDDHKGELRHRRNILADVWYGKAEQDTFPPVVWNYLNARPSKTRNTVRENLITLWQGTGRLGEVDTEEQQRRIALIFGEGGLYTASELKTRETLLDLLEAHVSLLNQDVAELTTELIQLMEKAAIR